MPSYSVVTGVSAAAKSVDATSTACGSGVGEASDAVADGAFTTGSGTGASGTGASGTGGSVTDGFTTGDLARE